MKKIHISSDALSDLNEGFLFYEPEAKYLTTKELRPTLRSYVALDSRWH